MTEPVRTHERGASTLALSDPELLQLMSLIERVSANQLRGILVSRLSLKQLVAIGGAIFACLATVFGAGYGIASFISEVKDTGTEYKVLAKDAELKAKDAELKAKDAELKTKTAELQALQATRDKLSETVSHLSRERNEAVSNRTRMAKLLGFYHLLSTCQKAEGLPRPKQDQAVELLKAHTKDLIKEKLATPDTKDRMVVGVYVGHSGDVLVSTGLGQWSEVVYLPIDHAARSWGAYTLPTHCWFPEIEK